MVWYGMFSKSNVDIVLHITIVLDDWTLLRRVNCAVCSVHGITRIGSGFGIWGWE